VRVTDANGKLLFEGIPPVGASLSYPGPVVVRVGDPAVVAATAGDERRESLGPAGRVSTVRLP
jgi:cytoskeleton protein RodZ